MSGTTAVAAAGPRPPEGQPARSRARELEGYRGIAALSIIAFHVFQYVMTPALANPLVAQLSRFEIVDILFVLSAYLLALPYARSAIEQDGVRSPRQFLFRRAVRILPLYWIGVTVVWAIRNPALPGDWRDLLEHLTFTQVFDRTRIFYTLGPTWSMSLEVFFYAALAGLGALAYRACSRIESRRARIRLLLSGCALLVAIPMVWNGVAFFVLHVPFDNWPVYFGPQARFGAFAAGMTLAVVAAARAGRPLFRGISAAGVRVVALVAVAGATWIDRPKTWGQVGFHDLAGIAWALLLATTVLGTANQRWSRALSWRALGWMGLISYSTYMWHEPIMMLLNHVGLTSRSPAALPLTLVVVLTASVVAGYLSYWVIEYPTGKLRSLRDSRGRPRDYYPELAAS